MTHADEQGFLAAILADPANNVLRLVYADWLEERGNTIAASWLRDGRIPLTLLDRDAMQAVAGCTYAPATYEKRFALYLGDCWRGDVQALRPRGYRLLWQQAHRYRRQIRSVAVRERAAWAHAVLVRKKPCPLATTNKPSCAPSSTTQRTLF